MKYPNIINVIDVVRDAETCQAGLPDGRWVPCRSLGFPSLFYRIRATWLVWTGRADALIWPGQ
jgi:hypothetical protein